MSCSALLALVPLTLVCGTSKAEDEPVEYDRTAVLAKLDEAAAKAADPEVKRALKKMRECTERSNKLLTLSGLRTLPSEIGQLTNLTGLTLHDNQLTTLPPEIGKLTNLTYLGLKRNQLTTFPPEICKAREAEASGPRTKPTHHDSARDRATHSANAVDLQWERSLDGPARDWTTHEPDAFEALG